MALFGTGVVHLGFAVRSTVPWWTHAVLKIQSDILVLVKEPFGVRLVAKPQGTTTAILAVHRTIAINGSHMKLTTISHKPRLAFTRFITTDKDQERKKMVQFVCVCVFVFAQVSLTNATRSRINGRVCTTTTILTCRHHRGDKSGWIRSWHTEMWRHARNTCQRSVDLGHPWH